MFLLPRPACLRILKKCQTLPHASLQAHGYLTPADTAAARTGANSGSLALHGGGGLGHSGIGDTTRLRNELEVVIVGCRGLPSRGGPPGQDNVAPAAYVHYQVCSIHAHVLDSIIWYL